MIFSEVDLEQALQKAGFRKKRFKARAGALGAMGVLYNNNNGCIVRIAAAVSGPQRIRRVVTISIEGEGRVLEEERTTEGITKAFNLLKVRGILD